MKRKCEEDVVEYFENPTKMLARNDNVMFMDNNFLPRNQSPVIGRPMLASTPQASVVSNNTRRLVEFPTETRPMTSSFGNVTNSTREAELRRVIESFVSLYEQLDKTNDTDVKPNYSYTELAFLAMLRSPNFCLPINEIYRYIQHRFQFYRNSTRKHWKNAVRHSLAKTMCFTKIAVGRGTSNSEKLSRSTYLWCIIPSSLASFARGDYRPSVDKESGTNTMRWGYYRVNAGKFWEDVGEYVATKMSLFRRLVQESHTPGLVFEAQVCNLTDTSSSNRQALQERFNNALNCTATVKAEDFKAPTGLKPQTHNTMIGIKPPPVFVPNMPVQQGPGQQKLAQSTFNQQGTSLPFPNQTDPWLPRLNLISPDTSACSVEADRRTPPYTTYDSGFDTCDSSPDESSCRFSNSCKQQLKNLSSPAFESQNVLSDSLLDDMNPLDLSPFSISELSDFSFGAFPTSDANKENFEFSPVTTNHSFQRNCVTPPTAPGVMWPMTSGGRYTPSNEFVLPPPPAYTPTQFRIQPQQQQQNAMVHERLSPLVWQQPQAVTQNAQVLVVYPNGTVAPVVLPQNGGVYLCS